MQAAVNNNSPVLPAFAYGMNLQLVRGQPQMPMEPFRILTTCSWEQNAYTVKIYVPLHGVKTDLLRAVFQPHTLDIKAINLQVRFRKSKPSMSSFVCPVSAQVSLDLAIPSTSLHGMPELCQLTSFLLHSV